MVERDELDTGANGDDEDEVHGALDALRGAWRELPPPPAARELAEEDALTRGAVEWTARAWAALPVPPVRVPAHVPARPIPIASWRRRVAAAAALLVVALGATLVALALRRGLDTASRGAGEQVAAGPEAADVPGSGPRRERATAPSGPIVVAADAERLELRSGPVRLYLIPAPLRPSNETSQ